MILKRGLLQIVLAALLLAAQHGALTHQLQQQNDSKKTTHAGMCDFHVAFAQILGAVNSAAPPLQIAGNTVESGFNHLPLAFPANRVVPASRGPPFSSDIA